jgi:hypothetical protein
MRNIDENLKKTVGIDGITTLKPSVKNECFNS